MAPSNIPSCVPEAVWKMPEIMVLRDGGSGQLTWPIFKGRFKSNSVNNKVVRSGGNNIKKRSEIMFSFTESVDSNTPDICPIHLQGIFRFSNFISPWQSRFSFLFSFSEKTETYNGNIWLSQCRLLCHFPPILSLFAELICLLRFLHYKVCWAF